MIDPAVFLGEPIEFKGICKIYPPTVREVMGKLETQRYIMTLCWNQDDVDETLAKNQVKIDPSKKPDVFEFLMANAHNSNDFKTLLENSLRYFTHEEKIYILPSQLCIFFGSLEDIPKATSEKDLRRLTKDNFLDFQNAIRSVLGFELEEPELENSNPIIKRIREAEKKRKRQAKKKSTKNGVNHTTTLCALCCMNIGLTPFNIGDLPYAAIGDLINTYQRKEKYEIDIQSLCAGADPKKVKPKYWVKPDSDELMVPISGIQGDKK